MRRSHVFAAQKVLQVNLARVVALDVIVRLEELIIITEIIIGVVAVDVAPANLVITAILVVLVTVAEVAVNKVAILVHSRHVRRVRDPKSYFQVDLKVVDSKIRGTPPGLFRAPRRPTEIVGIAAMEAITMVARAIVLSRRCDHFGSNDFSF
jgi:hypothetical protein